jgi:hypothetical protein
MRWATCTLRSLFVSTHYPSNVTADEGGPVYYQQQVLSTVPRSAIGYVLTHWHDHCIGSLVRRVNPGAILSVRVGRVDLLRVGQLSQNR